MGGVRLALLSVVAAVAARRLRQQPHAGARAPASSPPRTRFATLTYPAAGRAALQGARQLARACRARTRSSRRSRSATRRSALWRYQRTEPLPRDALAAARRAPGARRADREPRPDVRADLVAARHQARPAGGRDRRPGDEPGPAAAPSARCTPTATAPRSSSTRSRRRRTSRASTSRRSRPSPARCGCAAPRSRSRCPSCPRSRRSAAGSRRSSRGARCARSRSSTRAGASRWRRTRCATRSRGATIERLGRRGKYLIWEADDEVFLLMHLRMTGTLLYDAAAATRATCACASSSTIGQRRARFCDPRRFGTGSSRSAAPELDAFLDARLGVEPLGEDFTTEHLYLQTRNRRAPIKAVLLDQRRIAGVGNIYANEALFRAAHPPAARGAAGSSARRSRRCATPSSRRSRPASTRAARRSTTSATPTASRARFRTSSSCTAATASRASSCGRDDPQVRRAPGAGRTPASTCQTRPRRRGAQAIRGASAR